MTQSSKNSTQLKVIPLLGKSLGTLPKATLVLVIKNAFQAKQLNFATKFNYDSVLVLEIVDRHVRDLPGDNWLQNCDGRA